MPLSSNYAISDKPSLTGGTTQGSINDPGISYNQAGISYNQAGLTYGGFYGQSSVFPSFVKVAPLQMQMSAARSNAAITSQSYTYNEAGITYNHIGVQYGGLYNTEQIIPVVSLVKSISPQIVSNGDFSTPGDNTNPHRSLGPGFFLYITQGS